MGFLVGNSSGINCKTSTIKYKESKILCIESVVAGPHT